METTWQVGRAFPDDAPKVANLAVNVWGQYAFPINFYRQAIDIFGESIFLARNNDGELIGYVVSLCERGGVEGWIMSIVVASDFRGRGVGSALVQSAIEFYLSIGSRGLTALIEPDNNASLTMFRRLGFQESERIDDYYGFGEHVVKYRLLLKSEPLLEKPRDAFTL